MSSEKRVASSEERGMGSEKIVVRGEQRVAREEP